LIGYLLIQFRNKLKHVKVISGLALAGLLMPIGILLEVYLGLPPIFVLIGAMSMTASVIWLGGSSQLQIMWNDLRVDLAAELLQCAIQLIGHHQ
jgi:MFS superfamily sulfate permease-like transporter